MTDWRQRMYAEEYHSGSQVYHPADPAAIFCRAMTGDTERVDRGPYRTHVFYDGSVIAYPALQRFVLCLYDAATGCSKCVGNGTERVRDDVRAALQRAVCTLAQVDLWPGSNGIIVQRAPWKRLQARVEELDMLTELFGGERWRV